MSDAADTTAAGPQPASGSSATKQAGTAAMGALYFLFYGSSACWFPYLGSYLQQVGLTGVQIGLVAGLRTAVVIVSQPLWGLAGDLWGRRRSLLLVLLFGSLLLPGYGAGSGFAFLLLWTVLYALLSNPAGALIDSLVLDHLERHPGLSFGRIRLWGAVGWSMLALTAGWAISGRDMRLMFLLGAAACFANFLVAWRAAPRGHGLSRLRGIDWRGAAGLLQNRRLVLFMALVTLLQVGNAPMHTFFPVYMQGIGAEPGLIGTALGVQGVAELPLYLGAAAIIRALGLTRALVLAMLVMALRPLGYTFVSAPLVVVAMQAVHGSFSLFLVASIEYVNRLVPAEWRATGQGLIWAAQYGVGALLGNGLAGLVLDGAGMQTMMLLAGLVMAASALLVLAALGRPPGIQPSEG